MRSNLTLTSWWMFLVLAMAGCDDDPGVIFNPDAGLSDAGFGVDAGTPDRVPPAIVATTPSTGSVGVARNTSITIEFSEPMADAVDLTVVAEGLPIAVEASFDATRRMLTATLDEDLPSLAEVTVTVGVGFTDVEGNALPLAHEITFRVADEDLPQVIGSTPSEGAIDVSRRVSTIEITFSEPMQNAVGMLRLSGGVGTVGGPTWSSNTRFSAELDGLRSDTAYTIALEGFMDARHNPLAPDTLGGDAALDFRTRADDEAPRVLDSNPAEGQVNVRVRSTVELVIQFDEPMDPALRTVGLVVDGAAPIALTGTFTTDARTLRLPVAGSLIDDRPHRVDLSSLADPAGNALDGTRYLGDGFLDFRTGADSAAPRVLYSAPIEGSSDTSFRTDEIFVVFDKAMDTSVATLEIDDGASTVAVPVAWNLSGTRASLDVTGLLYSGRRYRVSLAGLADVAGTPVDVADVYLEDGALDFTVDAPAGEACRDALTIANATSSTGGRYVFAFPDRAFALNDGSMSCDADGILADGVIRYTKTTADTAGGGTVLHIRADSNQLNVSNGIDLEVYRDDCDPLAATADAARITCVPSNRVWESFLDVGPGDYYVWVAHNDSEFEDATITFEEITQPPEGETCLNPYSIASSAAVYTPPGAPGQPHTFTVRDGLSAEIMLSNDTYGAVSCDPDGVQGADAVIRFDKATDTSVLRVTADSAYSLSAYSFELLDSCDPRDPSATSYVCLAEQSTSADPERFITGPAGPYYAWLSAGNVEAIYPGGTVTFTEFEPEPGASCALARPLTVSAPGTFPVAPDVMQRLEPPSCGGPSAQYTWYRFTAPESATILRTNTSANLAIVDATNAREISCDDPADGVTTPMRASAFVPAGTEVCVGIESGSAVSALEIEPVPYTGLYGTVTDLAIERPINPTTGAEITITTLTTMNVTPTTLYAVIGTSGVLIASRAGGVRADLDGTPGSARLGNASASVGEAFFSLDDAATAAATQRLFRLVDPLGTFGVTSWDTGTSWLVDAFDAMTYDGVSLIAVNDFSASTPTTFFAFSPSAPGVPTVLGTHPALRDTAAVAADASYFYVLANLGGVTATEGLYRVPRATPTTATVIALFGTASNVGAVVLDPSGAYLYARGDDGDIHVVSDPGGSPRYLGILSRIGDSSDDGGMAWDPVANALIVLDSETITTGRFVRLD